MSLPEAVQLEDQKSLELNLAMERIRIHPEALDALSYLVLCLDIAKDERTKSLAWECFNDRVAAIIFRVKNMPIHSKGSCL